MAVYVPAGARHRRLVLSVLAALVVGLAVGFVAGRATSPGSPMRSATCRSWPWTQRPPSSGSRSSTSSCSRAGAASRRAPCRMRSTPPTTSSGPPTRRRSGSAPRRGDRDRRGRRRAGGGRARRGLCGRVRGRRRGRRGGHRGALRSVRRRSGLRTRFARLRTLGRESAKVPRWPRGKLDLPHPRVEF